MILSSPYAKLVEMLSGASHGGEGIAAGGWLFGDVQQAGHGVLQVVCAGMTLDALGLHLPPDLDYTWDYDNGADNLLRVGDRLLVLVTADKQDYYVLQKAVFT